MEIKKLNKKMMGEKIRSRRELLGWSRADLANKLKVSEKTIQNIEYGTKATTIEKIYELKQLLGVSLDFLMEDEKNNNMSHGEIRALLNENILSTLSVCSLQQLKNMEQIARLYVEGITK